MQRRFNIGNKVIGIYSGREYIVCFYCVKGDGCTLLKDCIKGVHRTKVSYICKPTKRPFKNHIYACIRDESLKPIEKTEKTFGEKYAEAF